jgi:hypothetical protein
MYDEHKRNGQENFGWKIRSQNKIVSRYLNDTISWTCEHECEHEHVNMIKN